MHSYEPFFDDPISFAPSHHLCCQYLFGTVAYLVGSPFLISAWPSRQKSDKHRQRTLSYILISILIETRSEGGSSVNTRRVSKMRE